MIEVMKTVDQFLAKRLVVDENVLYFDVYQKNEGVIAVKQKKGVMAYVYDQKSKQCKKI